MMSMKLMWMLIPPTGLTSACLESSRYLTTAGTVVI